MEDLVRRITQLERWRDTFIQNEVGRWRDWTPTVTQSGSVTVTVNRARYIVIANWVHLHGELTVTGSGTGGNAIIIGGIPIATTGLTNGTSVIGVAAVEDTGVAYYAAILRLQSTTTFAMIYPSTNNFIGVNPNIALGNTDKISFRGAYERA